MATFSVEISDAEKTALLDEFGTVANAQVWLDNAIRNKARQCIDKIIKRDTDKRTDRMTPAEKEAEVNILYPPSL